VSAGWVAAQVRSQSLASHCIGPAGARELAGAGSLDGALAILAQSSYGERLRPGLDLAAVEHEVLSSVLWNLRVLAGWSPALGASRLRACAGVFELMNLQGDLARIGGQPRSAPFELGSLASVSSRSPLTILELREVLRRSPWGDPGATDAAGVSIALQFTFARRLVDGVPEASQWAQSYCALIVSRLIAAAHPLETDSTSAANVRAILGSRVLASTTLDQLRAALPRDVASMFQGVTGPSDLWLAEVRWRSRLWDEALEQLRSGGAGPGTVVAAVAALLADALRVRTALEIAARAGRGIEVLDAVA
jgi:hypothetical protein